MLTALVALHAVVGGGVLAASRPLGRRAFLVAGLAMTVGWVVLDLPVGPGAAVGYVVPGLR